jgi:hypothetical protein
MLSILKHVCVIIAYIYLLTTSNGGRLKFTSLKFKHLPPYMAVLHSFATLIWYYSIFRCQKVKTFLKLWRHTLSKIYLYFTLSIILVVKNVCDQKLHMLSKWLKNVSILIVNNFLFIVTRIFTWVACRLLYFCTAVRKNLCILKCKSGCKKPANRIQVLLIWALMN